MDGTGSGSCAVAGFGISGVYALRDFVYIFPTNATNLHTVLDKLKCIAPNIH